MSRPRRSAARSVLAQGKRSVAIGGDVKNSVIVTGDNVTLKVGLGPESGALLELLEKSRQPTRRLRPPPLEGAPPPFPDRVDRETEAAAALAWGEPPRAVNLYGESGIGKSYVLAVAANEAAARSLRDGVVSLFAKSLALQDVLQACFEEFWDCEPPFKASDAEIRRSLRDREALVLVDSVELPPDEAQALVGAAPGCRFVLASREQALWDGKAVELAGLTEADALVLFERELGRTLAGDERPDAAAICRALAGHPLKIRQFAADARRSGRSLSELQAEVETDGDSRRRLLEQASPEEERILRVLALLDGASIGEKRLAELTALPNAAEVAARLVDKRLVRAHSPRYSVDSGLADEVGSLWPLEQDEEWVVTAMTRWAEERRLELAEIVEDLDALLALFRRAARRPGAERLVVRLGRSIDAALAWSRRFGAWGEVLAAVLAAAERIGDDAAVAWALHESGVREVALGRVRLGRQQLRRAARIRRSLGDEAGLAATRHNLAVARPRLAFLGPLGALPLATIPLVVLALVLASGGGATAWFLAHHHSHRPLTSTPSTSTTGETSTTGRSQPLSVRVVGRGKVTVSPRGLRCSARCRFELSLDAVTLSAHAGSTMPFLRWEGDCSGKASCRLSMDRPRSVVAFFGRKARKTAQLEVEFKGKGGGRVTSRLGGLNCTDDCAARFLLSTEVTLDAKADPGSRFDGWSGAKCSGTGACVVTMSGARHVVAHFATSKTTSSTSTASSSSTSTETSTTRSTSTTTPMYSLTIRPGLGGEIVSRQPSLRCVYKPPCKPYVLPKPTRVTLYAVALGGYETVSWGGACAGTPPTKTCQVTMNGDRTVSATFVQTLLVTITLTGSGGDVVARGKRYGDTFKCTTSDPMPCSMAFPVKESVDFTAETDPGFVFYTWGDDCHQGNYTTCTLTIDRPRKVTATFGQAQG